MTRYALEIVVSQSARNVTNIILMTLQSFVTVLYKNGC